MSRSGYSEDYDETFPNAGYLYARNVERASEGRRGQAFFRDLVAALDAMPVKLLIADDLVHEGEMCALGQWPARCASVTRDGVSALGLTNNARILP